MQINLYIKVALSLCFSVSLSLSLTSSSAIVLSVFSTLSTSMPQRAKCSASLGSCRTQKGCRREATVTKLWTQEWQQWWTSTPSTSYEHYNGKRAVSGENDGRKESRKTKTTILMQARPVMSIHMVRWSSCVCMKVNKWESIRRSECHRTQNVTPKALNTEGSKPMHGRRTREKLVGEKNNDNNMLRDRHVPSYSHKVDHG